MKDYNELVRRSIQKDFANAHFKHGREPKDKKAKVRRVVDLNESSTYAKYRRFIVGRLVRICNQVFGYGVWVQFVYDDDRVALNRVAGWSDNKREYLLDGAKFGER